MPDPPLKGTSVSADERPMHLRLVPLVLLVGCSLEPYVEPPHSVGVDWDGSDDEAAPPLEDAWIVGSSPGARAGWSVAVVGDVNGDGIDDVLVGAHEHSVDGERTGAAFLVHGPVDGRVDLDRADAVLAGERDGDQAGFSVAGAGDVDGDGFADLLIGAPGSRRGGQASGAAYIVRGPVTGDMRLSTADAIFKGERPYDAAGFSVAGLGDVDGDGRDDVAVGAYAHDSSGTDSGAAYVLRGIPWGTWSLEAASLRIEGDRGGDWMGVSVAPAGDLVGGPEPDVLVGAVGAACLDSSAACGAAYVIEGSRVGVLQASWADAVVVGVAPNDRTAEALVGPGDVDGDAQDDVVLGAWAHGGDEAGAVFTLSGPFDGVVRADAGEVRRGEAGDRLGSAIGAAGDVDGDGRADVLVGARGAGRVDLVTAARVRSIEGGSRPLGGAVAGGDVDGDGRRDLLLGIDIDDEGGADAGAVRILRGP